MSVLILEGLFSSLCFILSDNGRHSIDYQLALQRYVKRDVDHNNTGWTHTFSLWCLNPAIVFREIADITLSVILSSGTLSPMGSFVSELGVQFEACLEAPHVIDVESQLFAAVIDNGYKNCQLNASYRTSDGYAFQDGLGSSLEEIFKTVPGGVLVFFPSYKLLDKLRNRWSHTNQWSRLNDQKFLFVEPRSKTGDFESILKDYYACIRGDNKVRSVRARRGQKCDSELQVLEPVQRSTKRGAAFLAVCRGKVSEGIDFSDENARAVIIVGIPFPNKADIQVSLKKKYNDKYKSSKSLLSGSEWYCHQAFRALNQAAGRCIRHKFDHGAVILMDERFKESRNQVYISRWIRKSLIQFDTFDASIEALRKFFYEKEQSNRCSSTASKTLDMGKNNLLPSSHGILKRCKVELKDPGEEEIYCQKVKKRNSDKDVMEISSSPIYDATLPPQHESNFNGSPKNLCLSSRSPKMDSVSGNLRFDHLMFEEALTFETCSSITSLTMNCNSPYNAQQLGQTEKKFKSPVAISNDATVEGLSMSTVSTPGINIKQIAPSPQQKLSSRVSSSCGKRKKLTDFQMNGLAKSYCIDSPPGTESCCHIDRSLDKLIPESKRTDNTTDINSEPNQMKVDRCIIRQEKRISCLSCRNYLGSGDRNNLIPCTLTSYSKVSLALMKTGSPVMQLSEPNSLSGQSNVPVVVCDVSCLNHLLFSRKALIGNFQDTWSEIDGCVYRVILCPFCLNKVCLGLRVMAADSLNTNLVNKVLFYADRVHMEDEESKNEVLLYTDYVHVKGGEFKKEANLSAHRDLNPDNHPIPIESFAYNPKTDKFGSSMKHKLQLPKQGFHCPK